MHSPEPIAAVIPARYGSTRFPGKALALLQGKPMIEHVWNRCQDSGAFTRIWVATDDGRIADACKKFGAEVAMTSPDCQSGTDRVAEVAQSEPNCRWWVNVQGDEPMMSPAALTALANSLRTTQAPMATLIRVLDADELDNPNVVKVVRGVNSEALYFSRAPIPYQRDPGPACERHAHLGIYGYSRETLLRLSRLEPSRLEQIEKLEQLRALENGIRIQCVLTDYRSVGVDTPEDLQRAEKAMGSRPA